MSVTQAVVSTEDLISSPAFQSAIAIAEQHAEDVDARARFPLEAFDALRAAGALGWQAPRSCGGAGARIDILSEATFELSRRCSSTGMVFAMHQIQVAAIIRHRAGSAWFEDYLRRMVREQRLIASATSEVGIGGNLRKSIAAVEPERDGAYERIRFEKQAQTISYGAEADDLLTTLRRNPTADAGDQVLVLTHLSETETERISDWDTLGMRGTCSPGFRLYAACLRAQLLPAPFVDIATETMVPFAHILWANCWLGIAAGSFERARNFVRAQSRQTPGTTPPAASRLSEMSVRMAECRALIRSVTEDFISLSEGDRREQLATAGYAIRINNLKIAISEAVVEICNGALRVCGFAGYKNGGPYSVGRHLRDAHSAALMIANDRLHATNAALLLVHREGR
jgi:acyl-CoA dehydrogenase